MLRSVGIGLCRVGRWFAKGTLLLVELLIVAHALVPHHYHDGALTALVHVLGCEGLEEYCCCATHHHHHDAGHASNEHGEDCAVDEACAVAFRCLEQVDVSEWFVAPVIQHVGAGLLLDNQTLLHLSAPLAHSLERYKPPLSDGIVRQQGLRAPPMV